MALAFGDWLRIDDKHLECLSSMRKLVGALIWVVSFKFVNSSSIVYSMNPRSTCRVDARKKRRGTTAVVKKR